MYVNQNRVDAVCVVLHQLFLIRAYDRVHVIVSTTSVWLDVRKIDDSDLHITYTETLRTDVIDGQQLTSNIRTHAHNRLLIWIYEPAA